MPDYPGIISGDISQHECGLSLGARDPGLCHLYLRVNGDTQRGDGGTSGLQNLAQSQIEAFQVTPDSLVLQNASFSFDASVSEVLMAWCSGATLFLDEDELAQSMGLVNTVQTQGITHLTCTPSLLKTLDPEALANLPHLIVAGEACTAQLARRWSHRPGFYNAYGATENTVCTTLMNCTQTQECPALGVPLPQMQLWVLDERQQPVPSGVSGELWIGGMGLARGYLHQPELTAQSFVIHPETGDRLYRTGDQVRYRKGQLEYLGRLDHQVKLRGFRIERGEIETRLALHPEVDDALVLVRNRGSEPCLVAYITTSTPMTMTSDFQTALEYHLQQVLPSYMMPAAYLQVPSFPQSPNGKLDEAALPLPNWGDRRDGETYRPPQNPIEAKLVDLWASLLEMSEIGTADNFFRLVAIPYWPCSY